MFRAGFWDFLTAILEAFKSAIFAFLRTIVNWVFSGLNAILSALGLGDLLDSLTSSPLYQEVYGWGYVLKTFFPVDDFLLLFGAFLGIELGSLVYKTIIKVLRG